MMTEAEALKTLAREDPAVADDARTALQSLTSGGGLGAISLLRLQEYLWYALPAGSPAVAGGAPDRHQGARPAVHTGGHGALRGGLHQRGNRTDSQPPTACPAREGFAAYTAALGTSHAAPPDTDLLAWSSVMGPEERAAYDACGAAIELAVASKELKVGVSGWKTKRAALVERWLTRTPGAPGSDTWLSKISAERIEEWAHGHPGERSRLARAVMPKLLEPPDLPERAAADALLDARARQRGSAAHRPALHRARARRRGGGAVRLAGRRVRVGTGGSRNSTSTRCTRCARWRSTRWAPSGAAAPPSC